jgi:hypothetical protein
MRALDLTPKLVGLTIEEAQAIVDEDPDLSLCVATAGSPYRAKTILGQIVVIHRDGQIIGPARSGRHSLHWLQGRIGDLGRLRGERNLTPIEQGELAELRDVERALLGDVDRSGQDTAAES